MVSVLVMWLFSSILAMVTAQECPAPQVAGVNVEFCNSPHTVCECKYSCEPGYVMNAAKTKCQRKNPCPKSTHLCDDGRGGCHAKRTCNDNTGEIVCEKCAAGFENDGPKGCKELDKGTGYQVCVVDDGEIWINSHYEATIESCRKSCVDAEGCISFTYYWESGSCDHWASMCKKTEYRDKVISANVKGLSMNRKECDVNNGEKFISKLSNWVTLDQCRDACMNHGECNSFVYYTHGGCSFFRSCCSNTRIVENAHSERWRLPEGRTD